MQPAIISSFSPNNKNNQSSQSKTKKPKPEKPSEAEGVTLQPRDSTWDGGYLCIRVFFFFQFPSVTGIR